jgi:uncharacterized membrane protein
MVSSFSDSFGGASVCASSAADAIIINLVSHSVTPLFILIIDYIISRSILFVQTQTEILSFLLSLFIILLIVIPVTIPVAVPVIIVRFISVSALSVVPEFILRVWRFDGFYPFIGKFHIAAH